MASVEVRNEREVMLALEGWTDRAAEAVAEAVTESAAGDVRAAMLHDRHNLGGTHADTGQTAQATTGEVTRVGEDHWRGIVATQPPRDKMASFIERRRRRGRVSARGRQMLERWVSRKGSELGILQRFMSKHGITNRQDGIRQLAYVIARNQTRRGWASSATSPFEKVGRIYREGEALRVAEEVLG